MNKNIEYILSNEDIKFPTLYEEDLDSIFRKEGMTKEVLVSDLSQLINNFDIIIEKLINITKNNTNNFHTLCLKYKVNIYDLIVMLKLNKELALVVLSKFKENPNITLSKYEDYFPKEKNNDNNEDYDIMKIYHENIDKDFYIIKEKTSLMFKCIKEIYETKEECGIPLMCYMTKYYLKFMIKTKDLLDKFISIQNFNNDDIKIYHQNMIVFFDLIFQLRNLEYGRKVLYAAYINNNNDIFNYEENSDEWKELKKIIFKINSKDLNKVKEEYSKINDGTNQNIAYLDKIDFDSNFFFNLTKLAGTAIKYKFNSDENLKIYEHKENQILSEKVILEEAMKLLKVKLVKNMMERNYPKIELREKIYMKKEYPEITLDYIKSLLIKIYGEEIILKNFGNTQQPERNILDENIKEKMPIMQQKVKKEDKKYYVSSRLLNSYPLNINKKKEEQSYFNLNFFNFFSKKENIDINTNDKKPKALLIHIHGGGFLESNTFMLEKFLRETSNKIGIPILGIDYGCSPEHKYPEGLNDCYQAYMWILNHCEKELGFVPEKIFISGDSAGGNLLLGLVLLLIAMNKYDDKNIKLPDLIIPLYPCCTLDNNNATPSACLAFDKVMLSLKDIGYMREAYRGYYNNELDPFVNIVVANEKLLKYFPPSRFMTASHDALRDDTIRFLSQLCKNPGIDVKLYDLTNYQHGFMDLGNEYLRQLPLNIYWNEINEFLNK